MSEWFYNTGAVILHPETGAWWHVLNRYRDVDNNRRYYRLADATLPRMHQSPSY